MKVKPFLAYIAIISFFLVGLFLSCEDPITPEENTLDDFVPSFSSSTAEIRSFLTNAGGTGNAKLVFTKMIRAKGATNTGFYYVDFSENNETPVVHTIPAAKGAQAPVVSPDGEWVVFAKGTMLVEAGAPSSSKSSAYLCKLEENAQPILLVQDSAFEPRFVQSTDSLIVIFPTKAPNYAWSGTGKTMRVTVDVSGSKPVVGKPEVLFASAGFTGGLSTDRKYLCGGGGNVGMVDLTSGKTTGDSVTVFAQACNASISSSETSPNTVMYLTTMASDPKVNGGTAWQTWQAILINNSDKQVVKGFMYPTEYKIPMTNDYTTFQKAMWHHCEWSNHPYFAVATLNARRLYTGAESSEYQERIYLVNLKDSVYCEVLRPDTLMFSGIYDDNSGYHWPWIWIEKIPGFAEDVAWLKP